LGKAYANRKPKIERPKSDFYPTPKSLVWELLETKEFDPLQPTWEPACGDGAISETLKDHGFQSVMTTDLRFGDDFLISNRKVSQIITNPPFSLFDQFVNKAKASSDKFAFIGKVNFFGATGRNNRGVWKHLKKVFIFDRMVDFRSSTREDGWFSVGNLVTAWMIWDMSWNENYWKTSITSVQEYAKLGQIKD
jgi:hypothetical protein